MILLKVILGLVAGLLFGVFLSIAHIFYRHGTVEGMKIIEAARNVEENNTTDSGGETVE